MTNSYSKWSRTLLISLAFFLSTTACTSKKDKLKRAPIVQTGDRSLTTEEFARRLAKKLKPYDLLSARDEVFIQQSKQSIIQEFLHQYIIETWAEQNKISVTKTELQKEFQKIRDQYPDDISFREAFADENEDMESWLKQLQLRLLEKKVFSDIIKDLSPPSENEAKEFYKDNKKRFEIKEAIQLRQIVTENLTEAERLRKLLRKGGDFEELAKKYSISPDASSGGATGWIEKSTMEVFDKAFTLTNGSISPIWESHFGHHIIQVLKRRPARQASFEEVKKQIIEELFENKKQDEYTSWIDTQGKSLRVLINDDALKALRVDVEVE